MAGNLRGRALAAIAAVALLTACSQTSAPGVGIGPVAAEPVPSEVDLTGNGMPGPVPLPGFVNNHGTVGLGGSTVEVSTAEYYFEPTFIAAPPGSEVEVEVVNEASAPHSLTVTELGINVVVPQGQTVKVPLTVPESGPLRFYCTFHELAGMQGAVFAA